MELTCWRCHAIFSPEATGKRCPVCGSHYQAWLAKLRFAAIDFIGPIVLIGIGLEQLRDDPLFSLMFVLGSLVWAGFIYFQDTADWVETSAPGSAPLSKPAMPDSWKRSISPPDSGKASSQELATRRTPRLTWAEQLLIAGLVCGSIVYFVSRWQRIENLVKNGKISFAPFIYPSVFLGLIVYAVQRNRGDERILRGGVLTPGVLTGWYEKSSYTRTGYHSSVRIRYQFWTESGQKFEGSGTLISGNSLDSLSINQEPLKVFYLPQNPSKSVALCCTTSRVNLD